MNILINLSTMKGGGGQNVALNFLHAFPSHQRQGFNFYFLVAKGSAVHKFIQTQGYKYYKVVPHNAILRILYEYFLSHRYLLENKIDIIYSYFGIGIFNKNIPQISGSADSNLFFPEVDFWNHYRGISRLKKRIIDSYRMWGIKRATAVVFENYIIEQRAKNLYRLNKTKVIKPSINFSLENEKYQFPVDLNRRSRIGLFLCGWQLNKNILLIPSLANECRKRHLCLSFVVTAPSDNSIIHKKFKSLIDHYEVSNEVRVIGPVKKEQLADLYHQIDYVLLLSKLESFSNNIIEAWHYNKPLIVSNEPWARSICKNGAIYVDRDSTHDITNKLKDLMNDQTIHQEVVANGKRLLDTYPSINQRIDEEIDFIRYVYENN